MTEFEKAQELKAMGCFLCRQNEDQHCDDCPINRLYEREKAKNDKR